MNIEGSSALITGGGSGLGQATAHLLAELGAIVHVFDRDPEATERVAEEVGGIPIVGNVTSETDAVQAVDQAAKAGDGLRILVNCAGIGTPGRILGRQGPMPLREFEEVVHVNMVGTFNMTRIAASRMSGASEQKDSARGVIVMTSSIAAYEGQIGQAAYAASKGGIVAMTLPMAREFARVGIRTNTIAPGIFQTPLLGNLSREAQDSLSTAIPYPSRLGDAKEFAHTVQYIIENSYINGAVIRIDGALRMQPR